MKCTALPKIAKATDIKKGENEITKFQFKRKTPWLNCQMGLKKKYLGSVAAATTRFFWLQLHVTMRCQFHLQSPRKSVGINNLDVDLQITLSIKPKCSKLMKSAQFLFHKGISVGKDSLFKKWCWKKVDIYMRNMNLNPYLTQCIRIKLTWSIDLNVRTVTIKLLDKKCRSNLGVDKNFLGQKKHEPLKKSDKLDFTEMKIFCSSKDLLSWKSKP